MKTIQIYTDGSFDVKNSFAKWGFVAFDGEKELFRKRGKIDNAIWNEGRQISGECQAVLEALYWSKENNYKCKIFFDYIGLKNWVLDLFEDSKPWKTNKEYSQIYRNKMFEFSPYLDSMVWVKGHSGNIGNEIVDKFIKK